MGVRQQSFTADGTVYCEGHYAGEHAAVSWQAKIVSSGDETSMVSIVGELRHWTPSMARTIAEAIIAAADEAEEKMDQLRKVAR